MKSAHKKAVLGKVIVYAILILIAVVMIIPFLWMLSASIKSDREVFQMNPFVWIPANPKCEDLDEDSLWQIRGKYGILDIDRYFLTVTDQQFCSILFCKTGLPS